MKQLFILIFVAIISSSAIFSQQQPVHKKKMYCSPDGKLYFNKDLPVYFWISSSGDTNSEKQLIKSETTPQYSNPMYFDTEGRNTLRSPSAVDTVTKKVVYPLMDVQFQIYSDSKPPITKNHIKCRAQYIRNNAIYIPDSAIIEFSSADEMSGVENIMLSVNEENYKPYTHSFIADNEKIYIFKYYAVDNTGNTEKVSTLTIQLDKTAPKSTLKISGGQYENIISGACTIEITTKDTLSGVSKTFVALDDSIFRPFYGKLMTNRMIQGEHIIKYYSVDNLGNKENIQSYSFYVDNVPPQVIEEIMGKTFIANGKEFSAGTSRLKISSFDNKAGVKEIYYSINNTQYVKYEKPVTLSSYKGNLIIKNYAIDNVGNRNDNNFSNSRNASIPYVDLGEPWVGHRFIGPVFESRDTLFINENTLIELEAKDTESGIQKIEYQLDSGELVIYNKPFYISYEGNHRITVFGYDNTDNLTRQEFKVEVDTIGPVIYERFSNTVINTVEIEGKSYSQYPYYVVLFLSATDYKSGYENLFYKLNNLPEQSYMRDIRGFEEDKVNKVRIRALDKLGNQTIKYLEFFVK